MLVKSLSNRCKKKYDKKWNIGEVTVLAWQPPHYTLGRSVVSIYLKGSSSHPALHRKLIYQSMRLHENVICDSLALFPLLRSPFSHAKEENKARCGCSIRRPPFFCGTGSLFGVHWVELMSSVNRDALMRRCQSTGIFDLITAPQTGWWNKLLIKPDLSRLPDPSFPGRA